MVLLGHAISLAFSGDAHLTTRLALVVIPARVGATGLLAFPFGHVANLVARFAVLIVVAIVARGLLAFLFDYVTNLSASLAVLVVVAIVARGLLALVVFTDLVAILAVLIVAAVSRTISAAFARDTILVAWFALKKDNKDKYGPIRTP